MAADTDGDKATEPRIVEATPGDDLAGLLRGLAPGSTLRLSPGAYGPELFDGIQGTADAPITIIGPKDAVFDGQHRYEDVRADLNAMACANESFREAWAPIAKEMGKTNVKTDVIPSLGPVGQRGHIRISNCRHLRLVGFSVRGAWPTCIAIADSQGITLAGLKMQEGTFAIHAEGAETHGITVHNCAWTQDITADPGDPGTGEMWHEIGWKRIHGDDFVPGDHRGLDGDFFRSFGIRGKVTIRYCTVRHAFNAVHMYHGDEDGLSQDQNRDVRIHDNTFEFIRDNAIEAERGCTNWWIYRNSMRNVHKWLALEVNHSSHVYCFANVCWTDSMPSGRALGSSAHLHVGGAFFKTRKKWARLTAHGPHYFFHNSAYVRSGYIKKGVLKRFHHFNNAIQCVEDPNRPEGARQRPFFWQPGEPPKPYSDKHPRPKTASEEVTSKNFTRLWAENEVRFESDIIDHPDIPGRVQELGYPMTDTVSGDPGFVAPERGDLRLREGATAAAMADRLVPIRLELMPGYDAIELEAPVAAGAWQGEDQVRLGITPPGFEPDVEWQKDVDALDRLLEPFIS